MEASEDELNEEDAVLNAYVHYYTAKVAHQAIIKVNGMEICRRKVYVGNFTPLDDITLLHMSITEMRHGTSKV